MNAAQEETVQDPRKNRKLPRQLLSCTKCRERKVKCDRTKPCSACCARGQPRQCHFVVGEDSDYYPIQQSYEIRKLRAENLQLKERLHRSDQTYVENESAFIPESPGVSSNLPALAYASQTLLQAGPSEADDGTYSVGPSIDHASGQFSSPRRCAKPMGYGSPSGSQISHYIVPRPYPFPTHWTADHQNCVSALLSSLPNKSNLLRSLDAFRSGTLSLFLPQVPDEIEPAFVERVLSQAREKLDTPPEILSILFAALAQGSQLSHFDEEKGRWGEGQERSESQKGEIYIAAAMQALRLSSFMSRPTLCGLQALLVIGSFLTNAGRYLDAWILFGVTARLAYALDLHRDPKSLKRRVTFREAALRQNLWWWMLQMDQNYSLTLGRPLALRSIGDSPPSDPLTTDSTVLRLEDYSAKLTILTRQISDTDGLTKAKIDDFTDRLYNLWETLPETLQFDDAWLEPQTEIPEHPLGLKVALAHASIHTHIALLNRRRLDDKKRVSSSQRTPPTQSEGSSATDLNLPPSQRRVSTNLVWGDRSVPRTRQRGRPTVIHSSQRVLSAFLFCYFRIPSALLHWPLCQQAFNAALILALDALETDCGDHTWRTEQALAVFTELDRCGVHLLAGRAAQQLSWALGRVRYRALQRASGGGEIDPMAFGAGFGVYPMPPFFAAARPNSDGQGQDGEPQLESVMGSSGMFLVDDLVQHQFFPQPSAQHPHPPQQPQLLPHEQIPPSALYALTQPSQAAGPAAATGWTTPASDLSDSYIASVAASSSEPHSPFHPPVPPFDLAGSSTMALRPPPKQQQHQQQHQQHQHQLQQQDVPMPMAPPETADFGIGAGMQMGYVEMGIEQQHQHPQQHRSQPPQHQQAAGGQQIWPGQHGHGTFDLGDLAGM